MFYKMILSAEETAYARVQLTEEEANIVYSALLTMSENIVGGDWVGSCTIDLETPSLTAFPSKAICTCQSCETAWTTLDPDGDNICPNSKCGNANYKMKIVEG